MKHFKYGITILLLSIAMHFIGSSVLAQGSIYTTQNNTVFKDNQVIQLHGLNWFGAESSSNGYVPYGLQQRDYKSMISQMKTLGFNSVRIPFCPVTLQNVNVWNIDFSNGKNADLVGLKSLEVMDKIVQEFNAQHMYILMDHHSIDCSSITPLWYSNNYSEAQWINDLSTVATHYSDYEYFLGIDLKNEPYGSSTWGTGNRATDWNLAAEIAGAAVNSANSNILIFIEGVHENTVCQNGYEHWYGGNLEAQQCNPIATNKVPANKLVLVTHVYGPDVYNHSYFSDPNFPNNMSSIWNTHFGFLTDRGFTVIPDEWGGKYGNDGGDPKDIPLQNTLISYFQSKHICSSFYWSWNANASDTGGILQNDWTTPWQNKVTLLNNYYNNCSGPANNTPTPQPSGSVTPTPFITPSISPTPTPASLIKIFAAGTPVGGVYPTMDLLVNDTVVQSFNNIQGNAGNGTYLEFDYSSPTHLTNQTIKVAFTNDISNATEDRNLRVDKIIVDGQTIQTESPDVYSLGSWNQATQCNGGNKQSEWLHCNGYFLYLLGGAPSVTPTLTPTITVTPTLTPTITVTLIPSPTRIPTATPTPTTMPSNTPIPSPTPINNGSIVTVYAAGTPTNGVYPHINLSINNVLVASFSNIVGNPNSRIFQTLTYNSPTHITNQQIKVTFDNDASNATEDRNLMVDKVTVDGTTYQTEDATTYSVGSWSSTNGCGAGYKQSEWLHCNGYFNFNQPHGSVITIYAAGTPVNTVYPIMNLLVNDTVVQTFENVTGDPGNRVFNQFTYISPVSVSIHSIKVAFTNDLAQNGEDRNLRVDKIVLDGVSYETESPTTYSLGSWNEATQCNGGNKQSEWLHCSGYFTY